MSGDWATILHVVILAVCAVILRLAVGTNRHVKKITIELNGKDKHDDDSIS